MPPPSAPSGGEIALPEIDVHALPRLGRLAPQLGRLEAHAVERLRAAAPAVRVRVGEDVHAVEAVNPPAMPARVIGQPRVTGGLPVARDDGLTRLEPWCGVGFALLGHAPA